MAKTYQYTLTCQLPCPPADVFDAWMSSEGHTAMTAAIAHIDPVVGGSFDAYDGYITGKTLELDRPHRIVQSWRTQQFTDEHADSQVEVTFEETDRGTQLTLRHSNVPAEQTDYEHGGWQQHYFDRMKQRFEWLATMSGEQPS